MLRFPLTFASPLNSSERRAKVEKVAAALYTLGITSNRVCIKIFQFAVKYNMYVCAPAYFFHLPCEAVEKLGTAAITS